VQVFYPEHYNGAFAACPDPIDFHAYTDIDIYKDNNFYYLEGAHKRVAQPSMRDYLGHTLITTEEANSYELALGDHGRSGEQYDIWQAVYGPVGADGYPAPIYDKVTGEIDHKVADYWHEHYDLEAILERDWPQLGPELAGKIHIYVGSDDTYFLNDAVYLMEDFLNSTKNPPMTVKWLTGRVPSTAGTAIPRCPTPTRDCTTTPCTCPEFLIAFRRPRPPVRISPVGATDYTVEFVRLRGLRLRVRLAA